jgi:hypothetical protein
MLYTHAYAGGTFVTLDPNIKSIADLEGKKVALGKITQTFWGIAADELLEYGFGLVDGQNITIEWIGDTAGTTALSDGLVDAAFVGGYAGLGDPMPWVSRDALIQLAATADKVYYLDCTVEGIKKMVEATGTPASVMPTPAGTLPKQDKDISQIAFNGGYGCDKTLPEEVAYEYVKTLMEHRLKFGDYHAVGTNWIENQFFANFPWIAAYGLDLEEVVHPGAIRAYREAGVEIITQ